MIRWLVHYAIPYPGGPHIDRLAHEGEPTIDLPRAWLEQDSFDFSFSGLKSAVINTVHNAKQRGEEIESERFSSKFSRKCNRCTCNERRHVQQKNMK